MRRVPRSRHAQQWILARGRRHRVCKARLLEPITCSGNGKVTPALLGAVAGTVILLCLLDFSTGPEDVSLSISRLCKFLSTRSIGRFGRAAATLTVLPALVLSPLTAQAILIHDHHGHETHTHAISLHELDELEGNSEHQHEEHEHDAPAGDPAEGEGASLVIVLDFPEGLVRTRTAADNSTTASGAPIASPPTAVAIVTQQSDHTYATKPSGLAPPLRAHSALEGILLTSHALLL